MLTALELENFKGIGARQRIELAPLTLLFGANSAGKSTILQALMLAREILSHGDADVDRTSIGAECVNLGGFANYVHDRDRSKTTAIRLAFRLSRALDAERRLPDDFVLPDLDDDISHAWVELSLGTAFSPAGLHHLAKRLTIGIGEWPEELLSLYPHSLARAGQHIEVDLNIEHPYLQPHASRLVELIDAATGHTRTSDGGWIHLDRGNHKQGAVPTFGQALRIYTALDVEPSVVAQVEALLTVLICGILAQLFDHLDGSTYVGPLRVMPAPGLRPGRGAPGGSWATGLAAWRELAEQQWLVDQVNRALAMSGVDYKICSQEYLLVDPCARNHMGWNTEEVEAEFKKKGAHALDAIPPQGGYPGRRQVLELGIVDARGQFHSAGDVGVGVSQLIPVLAACEYDRRGGMVMVEQPELHIHPALQVGLGDVFMAASGKRQLLVETHSEHVILRILRRIRQTASREQVDESLQFSARELSVLYVESSTDGCAVRRLGVDDGGEFVDRWPKGFFAERMEELL